MALKNINYLTKTNLIEKWKAQKQILNNKGIVYQGHDTVSVVSLDKHGKIVAGTSTSGLFMKKARKSWRLPYCRLRLLCR